MDAPRIDCGGQSHPGKVRETNEDRFLMADLCKSLRVGQTNLDGGDRSQLVGDYSGKLLVVADGMGGHAAGERASAVAVKSIVHYTLTCMRWFFRLSDDPDAEAESIKSKSIQNKEQIHETLVINQWEIERE